MQTLPQPPEKPRHTSNSQLCGQHHRPTVGMPLYTNDMARPLCLCKVISERRKPSIWECRSPNLTTAFSLTTWNRTEESVGWYQCLFRKSWNMDWGHSSISGMFTQHAQDLGFYPQNHRHWAWWHMPIFPVLRR